MFDPSDPRASFSARAPSVGCTERYADLELVRFYELAPVQSDALQQTWYARGQNFVLAYSETENRATFVRGSQPDEWVLLLPDPDSVVRVAVGGISREVPGFSLVIVPAGKSTTTVLKGGRVVRLFTTRSTDLEQLALNRTSYQTPHPNVVPYDPWPSPVGGQRLRVYSLDVDPKETRFGRIWRSSTFMINYLYPDTGPRDTAKMSPHTHDDFEQCSLVLQGEYTHHIRWPWTTDMAYWRSDEHAYCAAPSVAVIPARAVHTSQALNSGTNQLVDIFCPPRRDFSERLDWVLNAEEYPMP